MKITLTLTMDTESSFIHFKSLSGDILSLPYNQTTSIESYRQQISQHLSHDMKPERIIIFSEDSEQTDNIPPFLQSEEVYSYFVRDDHQVHYSVNIHQECNSYHDFHSDSPVLLYKYQITLFKLISTTAHVIARLCIQEFSFYYDADTKLFFHQQDVLIDKHPSPYDEHVTLLSHHGNSLYALLYQHLNIVWFDKDIVAKLITSEWEDLESPYL